MTGAPSSMAELRTLYPEDGWFDSPGAHGAAVVWPVNWPAES